MKSNTFIDTSEGARIAKRLVNHWKHKFDIEETGQASKILMPTATVILTPQPEKLLVEISSELEDHNHLEQVVIAHINRMAHQEFEATWQHQ